MKKAAECFDDLCINTIRMMSVDAVQKANSGHPGTPMGLAPLAYVLWTRVLKHHPQNPGWPNRDRFILSAGHASMVLYSLLYLTGYSVSLAEIKNFRQWGSQTPGHPEYGLTPGIETTTGPLGQGFANGVGMAMAQRHLSERFNRPGFPIVSHFTYVIAGDGDLMEGVSAEAASLAGHLGLGKLICFFDDNHISIEGNTDLAFSEDVKKRFEAYGWQVISLKDDEQLTDSIENAIRTAQEEPDRPSLIVVRSHIGYGSPNRQDTAKAHGEPLGKEEVRLTKENLGWPLEPPFHIPDETLHHFRKSIHRGQEWEKEWDGLFGAYSQSYPELAKEWRALRETELPEEIIDRIKRVSFKGPMSTRQASGMVLNQIAPVIPGLIGGSADLAPSNNTYLKRMGDWSKKDFSGRNIHFGVREHAMGAILNGMSLYGGLIPYGGTFLVFSDYMKPAIRLAALMRLRVVYVFTHDSIALGEDGPTHQPVEQLAGLRAIPNLTVLRPADATETAIAWHFALKNKEGPTALVLTRQSLPVLDRAQMASQEMVERGGYILTQAQKKSPDLILIATGSEVHLAIQAAQNLAERVAVRIVSMPSVELFEKQEESYRESVLPRKIKARIVIEAASSFGWHRYAGIEGKVMGIDHFGASASGDVLMRQFGFTADHVVEEALTLECIEEFISDKS